MSFVIFLSPSEDKLLDSKDINNESIESNKLHYLESLWIKNNKILLKHREQIIALYLESLQKILINSDKNLLKEIYGTNVLNAKSEYLINIALQQNYTLKAINRYSGVAFLALDFKNLDSKAKDIILTKTYIFSNLFGVITASDLIPFYKLKQGCKVKGLTLKEIYAPFIKPLESFLKQILNKKEDFVIDLRAGIYTKIFPIQQNNIYFEFFKNGKIISHYSKFYRGVILRLIASNLDSNSSLQKALDFLTNIHTNEFKFNTSIIKDSNITLRYEII